MVTWLKIWVEGLLTHKDLSDGSRKDERGSAKMKGEPGKMKGDPGR